MYIISFKKSSHQHCYSSNEHTHQASSNRGCRGGELIGGGGEARALVHSEVHTVSSASAASAPVGARKQKSLAANKKKDREKGYQ